MAKANGLQEKLSILEIILRDSKKDTASSTFQVEIFIKGTL